MNKEVVDYYSTIRKKKMLPLVTIFCPWQNGPWGHFAKWDRSDRQGQIPYEITDRWNLKKLTHKTEE